MNEQTIQLLEKLAAKLGTTAEYLWGVLIKQAPIAAYEQMLTMIIAVIIAALFLRVSFKHGKVADWTNGDSHVARCIVYGVAALAGATVFTCTLCSNTIITCLVNPEYWALQQVLSLR